MRLMDQIGPENKDRLGVRARIENMEASERIPGPEALAMRRIVKARNSTEYDAYRLKADELKAIREEYGLISGWARNKGLLQPEDV